ncbi:gamma-glutamylcyclotransferase [Desertibacillus haloalkaliphilus]|uniref:gamma-glutamylcyclotransferase n=1 Tax=Desertibacillus haloalkaliphilus TaxID=1328930 RepID=UPI001C276BFF|nr:gamma-glutamylcyclotransferase family protein [Desertibacillus haloalkaliphilus]MBU8907665.1 gamma-glutamylcyclotransferase [Desertibacillus haloalkaliphilus]
MSNKYNVFVYGTLRQNEGNSHFLSDAKCLAQQAWTYGSLYDTGFGYPAMVRDRRGKVYGEVYEVNDDQLQQLNWLEGYVGEGEDNHYHRVSQTIYTDYGEKQAFVYVYDDEKAKRLPKIDSGDWKCHHYLDQDQWLYFAYGSCMDDERFYQAGVAEQFEDVIGCGVLENYQLAYTKESFDGGRADLVESSNRWVEGKVYKINEEALTYLFKREGVNANVYRPAFITIKINGVTYENVLTFLVINKQDEIAPPDHYAREILRGAKGFVSESYYQMLVKDLYRKFKKRMLIE